MWDIYMQKARQVNSDVRVDIKNMWLIYVVKSLGHHGKFICSLICHWLFTYSTYVLSTYYVPGAILILGAGGNEFKKTNGLNK